MCEVLGPGRFAYAIGPQQYHVGRFLEKFQRHEFLDGGAVAALGPTPVEIAQGLELADVRIGEASLQASPATLVFLPLQQRLHPGRGGRLGPMHK